MTDNTLSIITVAGILVAIIGAAYGAWRRVHPGVDRVSAALDAVIGKAAVTDRSGQIMEPSQPGLVHRVATVEEAVLEFRHMVGLLENVQSAHNQLEGRVRSLEDGRLERIVTRAESAQAWRAVADNNNPAIDET